MFKFYDLNNGAYFRVLTILRIDVATISVEGPLTVSVQICPLFDKLLQLPRAAKLQLLVRKRNRFRYEKYLVMFLRDCSMKLHKNILKFRLNKLK